MKNRIANYLRGLREEAELREIPWKTVEYLKAFLIALLIIAGIVGFYGAFIWMWSVLLGTAIYLSLCIFVVILTTFLIIGALETVSKREPFPFAATVGSNVFFLLISRFLDGKRLGQESEMILLIALAVCVAAVLALLIVLVLGKYFRDHPR